MKSVKTYTWRKIASACLTALVLLSQPLAAHAQSDSFQFNVSATIPPSPSDLNVQLVALTSGTRFSQNQDITYQLTYGWNLPSITPMTIEAEWGLGTIAGDPTPSVEILQYVSGSATSAYGGATPVIDLANRRITWTINSLPGNTTNQTVTFTLRTTNQYTGPLIVTFPVSGRITNPLTIPDSTVNKEYQYAAQATPTPSPSPTSSPTPSPSPTTTPTSSPSPTSTSSPSPSASPVISLDTFRINSVEIISQTATSAGILISTIGNGPLKLRYGTPRNNWQRYLTLPSGNKMNVVKLQDLTPETQYFFQVSTAEAGDWHGDVYTFTTPKDMGPIAVLLPYTPVVTTHGTVIYRADIPGQIFGVPTQGQVPIPGKAKLLVVAETVLSISLNIENYTKVKRILVFSRQPYVQGTTTENIDEYANLQAEMIEVGGSLFSAKMKVPSELGNYDMLVRIEDISGAVVEEKIAQLVTVQPLTVLRAADNEPIEDALILISKYDPETRLYTIIPNTASSLRNPMVTNQRGRAPFNLFPGQYQAKVTARGYTEQTVEFTVDPRNKIGYPQILLEQAPFSVATIIRDQTRKYWWIIVLELILSGLVVFLYWHKHVQQEKLELELATQTVYDVSVVTSVMLCLLSILQEGLVNSILVILVTLFTLTLWFATVINRLRKAREQVCYLPTPIRLSD